MTVSPFQKTENEFRGCLVLRRNSGDARWQFRWGQATPIDARWGQVSAVDARWCQMTPVYTIWQTRWRWVMPDDARWQFRWRKWRPGDARRSQATPRDVLKRPPKTQEERGENCFVCSRPHASLDTRRRREKSPDSFVCFPVTLCNRCGTNSTLEISDGVKGVREIALG